MTRQNSPRVLAEPATVPVVTITADPADPESAPPVALPVVTATATPDPAPAAPAAPPVVDLDAIADAVAARVAASTPPPPITTDPRLPSIGEYLYASIHRHDAPDAWDRMVRVAAAAGDTTTTDTPGLIPAPIVGDVFSGRPEDRPVVSSLGPYSGPSAGKTFSRPVITDPILDAATAAELADVADTLGVTGHDFTYAFVKRAARLSAEDIAFTTPQVLDVAARDLGRSYARGTEKAAATAIEAIDSTATAAAADAFEDAVYAAAAAMYAATGELPDRLWIGTGAWGFLSGAKATDGRPLYPRLSPGNAGGQNAGGARMFDLEVAGLRTTVSWALTSAVAVLGSSAVVECYEGHRVDMRADSPTTLGVSMGVGGAVATGALNAGGAAKFTVSAQVPAAAARSSK